MTDDERTCFPRCPGIDRPCPRAGKWLWTHRGRGEERFCLQHVTELLTALARDVAARIEARNAVQGHASKGTDGCE